jgi:hypothetical protein
MAADTIPVMCLRKVDVRLTGEESKSLVNESLKRAQFTPVA